MSRTHSGSIGRARGPLSPPTMTQWMLRRSRVPGFPGVVKCILADKMHSACSFSRKRRLAIPGPFLATPLVRRHTFQTKIEGLSSGVEPRHFDYDLIERDALVVVGAVSSNPALAGEVQPLYGSAAACDRVAPRLARIARRALDCNA